MSVNDGRVRARIGETLTEINLQENQEAPEFSTIYIAKVDGVPDKIVRVVPHVLPRSLPEQSRDRLSPASMEVVAKALGADVDLSSPMSPLQHALYAPNDTLLKCEESILANHYLTTHPKMSKADLKNNQEFQTILAKGFGKAVFVTVHEYQGAARVRYHQQQIEDILEHPNAEGMLDRTWFELYPVEEGTTCENLFARHSTAMFSQAKVRALPTVAYHVFQAPLHVIPTDPKTGMPVGNGYYKSFVAVEFSSKSSTAKPRMALVRNQLPNSFPVNEEKESKHALVTPCALRVQVAKTDERCSVIENIKQRADVPVLLSRHGMTKTHITRIINLPTTEEMEAFLARNQASQQKLGMAREHELFGNKNVLTILTGSSKVVSLQDVYNALECEWVLPLNHTHLRAKTLLDFTQAAAALREANARAKRSERPTLFFRLLDDHGKEELLISPSPTKKAEAKEANLQIEAKDADEVMEFGEDMFEVKLQNLPPHLPQKLAPVIALHLAADAKDVKLTPSEGTLTVSFVTEDPSVAQAAREKPLRSFYNMFNYTFTMSCTRTARKEAPDMEMAAPQESILDLFFKPDPKAMAPGDAVPAKQPKSKKQRIEPHSSPASGMGMGDGAPKE